MQNVVLSPRIPYSWMEPFNTQYLLLPVWTSLDIEEAFVDMQAVRSYFY